MARMRIDNQEIRDADIFETIVDHFPDIIHSVDDDGNIVFANNKAETLLGYSLSQLLTMNVRELYADEVLEALEEGFDKLKQTGEGSVESILKDKEGNLIPVEIRSFSIYDDEGNFVRTFSILRDIREIKKLQHELIHAGRLAAIGELAAGILHDVSNPLSVIELTLAAAKLDFDDPEFMEWNKHEEIKQYFKDLQRASDSVQKLVTHLRIFSRGMVEKKEITDIGQCLEDALFLTKSRIHINSIQVHNQVETGKYFTSGCSNHIEQVFANLIANACDAMADTTSRHLYLAIAPHANEGTHYWDCTVRDTGMGIDPEIQEEVWGSFFTTKPKGKGTGLGLATARGIINEHNGTIHLESTKGTGTVITIRLLQSGVASY